MSPDTFVTSTKEPTKDGQRVRAPRTAPTFGDAISAYFYSLPLVIRSSEARVLQSALMTDIANSEREEGEEKLAIGVKKNLAESLMDPASSEWIVNFTVFRIIKHLRRVWRGPLVGGERENIEARAYALARINELNQLIYTTRWSVDFLQRASNIGNFLAKSILQVIEKIPQSGAEENVSSNKGITKEDALKEVRHRLQRGKLWRDDPWWPKADAPRSKVTSHALKQA